MGNEGTVSIGKGSPLSSEVTASQDHTPSSDTLPQDILPPSHYASYDLIGCIQDSPTNSFNSRQIGLVTVTFFTTCIVVSLIGGFGMNMALNKRRYVEGVREGLLAAQQQQARLEGRRVVHEDPVKFATRALGWGTFYSIVGSGVAGLTTVGLWKV